MKLDLLASEREIDWGLAHPQIDEQVGGSYRPKIFLDAYNLDPRHPLILLALSVFEDRKETKELRKHLKFPRIQNDAQLAARTAEILMVDKDSDNALKSAEIALGLPTDTTEDKAKAQAVLHQIEGKRN